MSSSNDDTIPNIITNKLQFRRKINLEFLRNIFQNEVCPTPENCFSPPLNLCELGEYKVFGSTPSFVFLTFYLMTKEKPKILVI